MMTTKKSVETISQVKIDAKCGQCIHFKTGPRFYEELCNTLGIKAGAQPCTGFFPDATQLRASDPQVMIILGELYNKLDSGQAKIMASFLGRHDWFKKAGLRWMQEVVFPFGQDYLCNYVHGYVVGISRDGQEIMLNSQLEELQRKKVAHARMMRESIMTLEEFEKHKQYLIRINRVMEPARSGLKITTYQQLTLTKKERAAYDKLLNTKPDEYKPPNMDSVPDTWRDKRALTKVADPMLKSKSVKKAKKSEPVSLKIKRS